MTRKKKRTSILTRIFIILNILFATGYLFSLLAGHVNPETTSFFAIFALIYPQFLLVNLFFVFFWWFVKPVFSLLSIALIILSFGTLSDNLRFAFAQTADTDTSACKVLSYNIQRFGLDASDEDMQKNKVDINEFLVEQDAHVVCLQEYHGHGKTLYEPLAEMKRKLQSQSYYYESYFNPRFDQITGLVIFSKYQAINKGKLKFEGSRTFGIYTDLLINKDTVRFYNIHLASIQLTHSDIDFVVHAGNDEKEIALKAGRIYAKLSEAFKLRVRQLGFLLQDMKECPYPFILAGDFNDTPSSYTYSQISRFCEDTFTSEGNGFGITYAGQIPLLRIDYIMHDNNFVTEGFSRERVNYSDHYPISARLTRKP
ncbi:MAG: endonuclease/exonuclease/phosphatase family protein [bacterium]